MLNAAPTARPDDVPALTVSLAIAVNILGQPVSVDYLDERKFATAAAAVARAGKQIFDLTWRKDYQSGEGVGWEHFAPTRAGSKRTRHWGMDHWASRTGQGAYIHWLVGNAILPEVDRVGNGFVSVAGYQAQGYSVVKIP